MQNSNDNLVADHATIFAWATAAGRAGVAVLRISGPQAFAALPYLGVEHLPPARHASLVCLKHPLTGSMIDRCLALTFPAPHSFTGEDVLELHCHGSRAVMQQLTEVLCSMPQARLAEAGEFSRRAFFNQKMDLVEAEGLADLIDAETSAQHLQALRQMDGHVGLRYADFRRRIIHALALMEAYIDFPDEDIPDHVTREAHDTIFALKGEMDDALDDRGIGEKIRDGLSVVIIGAPNAGKSSLLNALAKRDAAIVSDQAGTTRDLIDVHLTLDGYALTLTDTAGLRKTCESIEHEGIRRATVKAAQADVKIALFDVVTYPELDSQTLDLVDENTLLIFSKSDAASAPISALIQGKKPLLLSAKNGQGIDALIGQLKDIIHVQMTNAHTPIITRARHRVALQEASDSLSRYLRGGDLELMTEDLRMAAQAIAKITGQIHVDDVLDVVFSSFCIGK